MRAVLVGAVESTRVAARCLIDSPGWTLAGMVTLPIEQAGRHSDFRDLACEADEAACPLLRQANANSDEAVEAIAALRPDYLFVIGWSQLCGDRLTSLTDGRVVGYHPAPLPRLRGRGVIPWTILLDEPITASTLFLIDAGTDSGPILGQRFFHLAPDETAATLYARHMSALGSMLPDVLTKLAAGTASPQAQDDRFATWAARRRPEDGELMWFEPAASSWRKVRACGDPYPGAHTSLNGEMIVIRRAEPVSLRVHSASIPGQIVERDANSFVVRCGDGNGLLVREWDWNRTGPPPLHAIFGPRGARAS